VARFKTKNKRLEGGVLNFVAIRYVSTPLIDKICMAIDPNGIYTTQETQDFLKISSSTMKRLLKRVLINANKIGGQYRFLGKEILRAVSPAIEKKAVYAFQRIKKKIRKRVKNW
jgi:hypothetical protein